MMKKDTLYLHVGWSKTGTSAIQAQLQTQKEEFREKGILYPQALQWPDHSHHMFALSFKENSVYKSGLTPDEALQKLEEEIKDSDGQDVVLSSELSPIYFNNNKFKNFSRDYFSQVKIIFTVRPQSELLLSLFNQLVKDQNVRYGGSLFTLAMRNLVWLNFFQNIKQWARHVDISNMFVVPYSKVVVSDFFSIFNVAPSLEKTPKIVNPSLPSRCLPALQAHGRHAKGVKDFVRVRDAIVDLAQHMPAEDDRHVLFSDSEQRALDDHFKRSNIQLAETFGFNQDLIHKSSYKDIMAISPDVNLSGTV